MHVLCIVQIGSVELYSPITEQTEVCLQNHQLITQLSAYNAHVSAADARLGGSGLAPQYGCQWVSPGTLSVRIPIHLDHAQPGTAVGVVKGGKLGWILGEGKVSNWYDHPLEINMDPIIHAEDPDGMFECRHMLVVRPKKEPLTNVDHVHTISFRREYPDGEVTLVYTHPR